MLHRPGCLLLDEPTVGLDIGSRESVVGIVRKLVAEQDLGVLWATHLIDEIAPTDQIVVLHRGKVLFAGNVTEFLAKTGSDNVRAGFRSITGTGTGTGLGDDQ